MRSAFIIQKRDEEINVLTPRPVRLSLSIPVPAKPLPSPSLPVPGALPPPDPDPALLPLFTLPCPKLPTSAPPAPIPLRGLPLWVLPMDEYRCPKEDEYLFRGGTAISPVPGTVVVVPAATRPAVLPEPELAVPRDEGAKEGGEGLLPMLGKEGLAGMVPGKLDKLEREEREARLVLPAGIALTPVRAGDDPNDKAASPPKFEEPTPMAPELLPANVFDLNGFTGLIPGRRIATGEDDSVDVVGAEVPVPLAVFEIDEEDEEGKGCVDVVGRFESDAVWRDSFLNRAARTDSG